MKKYLLLPIIGSLAFLTAACGAPATPEPVEFTIEMSEFAYSPETLEVKVGQEVTIILVNLGSVDHEFMIGKDVMMTDGRANGFMTDFFETGGVTPMVMGDTVMVMGASDDHGSMDMEEEDGHDDGEMDMGEGDGHDDDEMDMGEGDGHDDGEMGHGGFMVTIGPDGKTATITFTVTAEMVGEWELGCFLAEGSHHVAGMTGTLVVTE
ncbi:MAG: cupredoxin domain-containing protein [Anaerolineae bacterium]|nr:cupredoxin domain-containing protein [Anaerolineae bacterium]